MVFVIGLMFQATSPVATLFVTMQHNVTLGETEETDAVSFYTYGVKDIFTTFFYLLIAIVIHAVIQEYILDKVNRKMHLSKVKHSKFNESGQLLVFYAVSAGWGIDILIREKLVTSISSLWDNYPLAHAYLPFIVKFYFIIQIAYWIHCFPELYFQKVKKDEMSSRITYAALYIVFITAAYVLNFTRVALCMMVLHYTVEFIYHLARLLYFAEKTDLANTGFMAWNVLFVIVRVSCITLSVLTFWYGLARTSAKTMDISEGNFNTQIIRINCLAALCLLQAWMMWNFITFHLKRRRERTVTESSSRRPLGGSQKRKDKKSKVKKDDDSSEASPPGTPKTNSAENGSVRQRTPKSKRGQ